MASRCLLLALTVGFVGVAFAAEPTRYATLTSLKALECLESWEQLCSPPASLLDVAVFDDGVEVTPFMDDTAFSFRVKARSAERLDLELESCKGVAKCTGMGQAATLRLEGEGHAVFEGPDVYELLKGRIALTRLELVSTEIYRRTSDDLERRYVPGGKCAGLMGYERTGGRPCLNAPAGR